MNKTEEQYRHVLALCQDIFEKKTKDYGAAWRILRPSSLTDQIFIKANRIRTIQENGSSKVDEGVQSEFIGIVNYSFMALIQLEKGFANEPDLTVSETMKLYTHYVQETNELMLAKNHDYGEAWRDMRISSLTDLILMKIMRVKQIEDNDGATIISEGIDANYMDMANYALFALIKLSQEK
ncbi:MAG: hypothetical protein ACJAUV_000020 [Flavobacteriales bacterium]|jgi:hypothetical protein